MGTDERRGRGIRARNVTAGWVATGVVALLACTTEGGGHDPAAEAGRAPERTDSAGTVILSQEGPDRPLDWRTEEVLRLGPADEGPAAFFRVDPGGSGLDADTLGRIYVLDTGHREVRVFERDGRYRQTLGRPGEGPSELTRPTRLFVTEDGTVAVADSRKRALVRFAPDGAPMPAVTLREYSLASSDLRGYAAGGLVFTLDDPYATLADARARRPRTERLIHLPVDIGDPAATGPAAPASELDQWTERPDSGVHIRACDSRVSFGRPLKPSQPVRAERDRIARVTGASYAIGLLGPHTVHTSVRRALVPVSATPELAARDFRTVSIELANHEMCEITGERAVEAAGFDPVVPWITDLRIAPDGDLFVERRDPANLPARRIDVFEADGAYRGTLPEDFPLPAAFHGPDTFLRVERSELDVPMVVVYRIVRQ